MTARFFCSTGLCALQSVQLCYAAQREAALRAQLAAVTAERDELAAALESERAGKRFYMDLFLSEKEATHGR